MSSAGACAFCRQRHADASTGQMLRTADGEITAHYNCTLFSPKVVSANSDSEDVFGGFDIETVKNEIKRANKLKCSHCNKYGASVGCYIGRCKKSFHYECVEAADGKCIEDCEKQIYIAYCAEHKDQAKAANNEQVDDNQHSRSEEFHGDTGQKSKKKNKEMKPGKANTGRITKQTKQMGRRSYNVKKPKKLHKSTAKKMKTVYSAGVIQGAKRRKQSETILASYSHVTKMKQDNEEMPGTSASARQSALRSDSDSDDSDLPIFDGCNISQSQKTPMKRWDEPITSQSSQQIKEAPISSPHRCTSRSSSESSESLLSPKRCVTYDFNGFPEKDRKPVSERSTDPQKEDMDEEDNASGNAVVTDEASSFDHPFLEMDPEEQPATNVPDDTVIPSPSRTSPVVKQCSKEQPGDSSTKDAIAFPSIREKPAKTKIISRLRRRLITRTPNTTNTNDSSHTNSLNGSTSADHYLDGQTVQSIDYCNEPTTQTIGTINGTDRPATHSSYGEDMYAAQRVGSCNGEFIPVIKPDHVFSKSSHAEPMVFNKYNSSLDEKPEVYPNVYTPFAVQLIRQLTLLNEQAKISNTQVISETCPSNSPLVQDIYGGTSGTCPSVSLAQNVYDGISGTCPSASPLAHDAYGGISGTCPSASPLAHDAYGGISGTCPSASPLAHDAYGGISGTCPSASPLAHDAYGGTSGTCPSASPLAQDAYGGISGTCPSASPLAQAVNSGTSGVCPLVSPIPQDVHVEQQAMSLPSIDDTSLEDLPQAFICPNASTPETNKEARLSRFLTPEKISEMSAKLVSGALAKQFNFSNIAMQIQSPISIRSAKNALSHNNDDQTTSESSPRPGPSSEATQKHFNEVNENQRSSGLQQCDKHCPCYSRLEYKVDSLLQGQDRLMSLLEGQHRKLNLLIESMTKTPDSVERSFPSPPLSTSSFPGIQPLEDHNYFSMQPPH